MVTNCTYGVSSQYITDAVITFPRPSLEKCTVLWFGEDVFTCLCISKFIFINGYAYY